jgi:hypothetical protein
MDAMALVCKYEKLGIFLAMTCNPNWDEIKRELLHRIVPTLSTASFTRSLRS